MASILSDNGFSAVPSASVIESILLLYKRFFVDFVSYLLLALDFALSFLSFIVPVFLVRVEGLYLFI